ncbi:hypothetical protein LINPERHAP1_LOCUS7299, partial [Linum perenne]
MLIYILLWFAYCKSLVVMLRVQNLRYHFAVCGIQLGQKKKWKAIAGETTKFPDLGANTRVNHDGLTVEELKELERWIISVR